MFGPEDTSHGSARFARFDELKQAGLTRQGGIILARAIKDGFSGPVLSGEFVHLQNEGHVTVIAPPGAGKTAGIIVPNALTYQGTILVTDIKRGADGVYAKTAGRRAQMGQEVHAIDPFGLTGAPQRSGINLFQIVDVAKPADGAKILARVMAPVGTGDYWEKTSTTLIAGLIAFAATSPDLDPARRHLGQVRSWLMGGNNIQFVFEGMEASGHDYVRKVGKSFGDMMATAEKQFFGVLGTAQTETDFLDNPEVVEGLCSDLCDLRTLKARPQSLYLAIPESHLMAYGVVARLVIEAMITAVMETPQNPHNHPLLLIDEFANLGKMDKLRQSLTYIRSSGCHVVLIAQSMGQLVGLYGKNEVENILACSDAHVFMALNDHETRQFLSTVMGNRTVVDSQWIPAGPCSDIGDVAARVLQGMGAFGRMQDHKFGRRLLNPDEIAVLPKRAAIILTKGIRPILAHTIAYYEDSQFCGLAGLPVPGPTGTAAVPTLPNHPANRRGLSMNVDDQPIEHIANPEERIPLVLLIDTSTSMGGTRIGAIVNGLQVFPEEIRSDSRAKAAVEVAVVTFNDTPSVVQDFMPAADFIPMTSLPTGGNTDLGAAIDGALDLVETRLGYYDSKGLANRKFWLWILTDAEFNGNEDRLRQARERLRELNESKLVTLFSIGCTAKSTELLAEAALSKRPPLQIQGLKFRELFVYLSKQLVNLSNSKRGEEPLLDSPHSFAVFQDPNL